MTVRDKVRSSFKGGEGKRALLATAAGAVLGLIAAVFARSDKRAKG